MAESLCGRQAKQFKDTFGVVGDVGMRNFFSNSFHCPVWKEYALEHKIGQEYYGFHNCNGGHIFYYRINTDKNLVYIDQYVKTCMKVGFYAGYLGFTRMPDSSGDNTRMNDAKREEISLRKSM